MSEHNLVLLKRTIMDMIADIKDNIVLGEEEQSDLIDVEFFFSKQHPEMTANHVIKKVLPHKDAIVKRDEAFFSNNKFIFSSVNPKKYDHYKSVLSDPVKFNAEDKKIVWEYFDTLILLAERIKKDK